MSSGVAVVTGGSRALGAATARALARAGYAVVVSYRSAADEGNSLSSGQETL